MKIRELTKNAIMSCLAASVPLNEYPTGEEVKNFVFDKRNFMYFSLLVSTEYDSFCRLISRRQMASSGWIGSRFYEMVVDAPVVSTSINKTKIEQFISIYHCPEYLPYLFYRRKIIDIELEEMEDSKVKFSLTATRIHKEFNGECIASIIDEISHPWWPCEKIRIYVRNQRLWMLRPRRLNPDLLAPSASA